VRANYAEVSNTANPLLVNDVYNLSPVFDGVALANVASVKNFADLKPERTKSIELGLEMRFLKDAVGFDFSYYKTNTFDQIIAVAASRATGYSSKVANVGEVQNQGLELSVFARPIVKKDFDWKININWARNRNLVVDLGNDIDNLQLGSFQGGVSINAAEGQPYGTIRGNNFVYNEKGQRVIGANGFPLRTATSNEIIGNVNPDWIGGIQNTLRYKNLSLGFLIDVRQGGDIFSLDLYYGLATGLYPETAVTNDLGNEARAPLANGGGIIFDGVKADGTPNDKRVSLVNFGAYGYARNPAAAFVYDASFVKLREITLNYTLPSSIFTNSRIFKGITISAYGRNLWIIHKNIPYADPEEGFSSGNIQGYQGGAYPTTRTFGLNFNFKF
jgi:outer membrane receptor protein involved in Fe transport